MKPLGVEVDDLRSSFVWTRCHLDILLDPQAESRLKFLGRRFPYQEAFEGAATPGSSPHGLDRPWIVPPGQPFWSHYLEGVLLPNVTATQAWRTLVPFRRILPVRVKAPGDPRIVLHGFYYPHGVALGMDVTHRDKIQLESAVEQLISLRLDPTLEVELPDSEPEKMCLDDLASVLMDGLSSDLLDGGFSPSTGAGELFSVVTVVKARRPDELPPPEKSPELHRVLEGLVSWTPHWNSVVPRKLADASLPIGLAPPDHVLYAAPRGRAVWFPLDFAPSTKPRSRLSTLHRDLTLTSLQVESLSGLLLKTRAHAPAGNANLQEVHKYCAGIAAGLLGRLYGNSKEYLTESLRNQIEQNGYASVISEMRKRFGMVALFP